MTRVIALAIGITDGVNDSFRTPSPYRSGTLVAMINGMSHIPDQELTDRDFRLSAPPKAGSVVTVRYTRVS